MNTEQDTEYFLPTPRSATSPTRMRTDTASMLLPFFPEERGLTRFESEVAGHKIVITTLSDTIPIATTTDRKILTFIAGAVARMIRDGHAPNRFIELDARDIVLALHGDTVTGGSDYQRIKDRMRRLENTIIETEMPIGNDTVSLSEFRWLNQVKYIARDTSGGRQLIAMRVEISEPAFRWMTLRLGIDIGQREYQKITASRSSVWRIYEICLAQLLENGEPARIHIDELRERVPIRSELKIFKTRTLRTAMQTIMNTPEMSGRIRIHLEQRTDDGFVPTSFSRRAHLDRLFIRIRASSGRLPIPAMILGDETMLAPAGGPRTTGPLTQKGDRS